MEQTLVTINHVIRNKNIMNHVLRFIKTLIIIMRKTIFIIRAQMLIKARPPTMV
jgi:hypothetical protein